MHLKSGVLLSAVMGLVQLTAPVLAVDDPNLDYLIFEPVPLQVTSTLPASKNKEPDPASYQATELAPLPQNNKVPLMSVVGRVTTGLSPLDGNAGNSGSATDDVAAIEAHLKQQETLGDAFNQQLTETLTALASAYEKQGDYAKALSIYERANHVIRVNNGLFSLEQEPMIKHMISDHLARGDVASADDAQAYLFYLRSKVYGSNSVALVPALQELAQWKIAASRMEAVLTPPPPSEGGTVRPKKAGSRGSSYDLLISRLGHLKEATELHESATKLLERNDPGAYSRLSVSELQYAVSNFLYTRFIMNVNPVMNDMSGEASFFTGIEEFHSNFSEGRRALERRVKLLTDAKGPSPVEQAQAKIDLVEWLLTTGGRGDYREIFEAAYRDLVASGADQRDVDRLFKPALPVQLPTFIITSFTRQALGIPADVALEYRGYVDVKFDIAQNGEITTPKVLYRSADTPERVVDLLVRSLRRSQFRPQIVDGKLAARDDVTIRYYYTY